MSTARFTAGDRFAATRYSRGWAAVAGLLVTGIAALGLVVLMASARVSATSDEAAAENPALAAASSINAASSTGDVAVEAAPFDLPPVCTTADGLSDSDDVAINSDHDFSVDYLTALLPTVNCPDMDFRHAWSHGLSDEHIFALALPRSIPTAIP